MIFTSLDAWFSREERDMSEQGTFCWAPYGEVAAAVHGPDGGLVPTRRMNMASDRIIRAAMHARPTWLWGVYRIRRDGTYELWPRTVKPTRAQAVDAYVQQYTLHGRAEYERERRRGDTVTLRIFTQPDLCGG
jgi:hypothetical protein